jgi:DNA-binding beta-propeller fold protein YncE
MSGPAKYKAMRCVAALLFAGLGCLATPHALAASAPLTLERTIPLKGVSGRIDHLAIDPARQRLMVAELGNDTVDVIDIAAGQVIHRIAGLKEPQGVAYAPDDDLIVVAIAGDGTVRLFDGTSFAAVGVIALGDDADNIRIDPHDGQIVVGYGGGALAFIDPHARTISGTVKLTAHPEGFQLAPDGGTIFVNVPDAREIAVVDRSSGKQVAHWKTPDTRSNFPMVVADNGAAIASVFRSPSRLTVFRPASGEIAATIGACGDADDVFFDAKRRRFYISCGEGVVDVLGWDETAATELARIATVSGARTSLFVPQLDRLFVASRAGWLGGDAAILVFRPSP